jgi:hypothetical protein
MYGLPTNNLGQMGEEMNGNLFLSGNNNWKHLKIPPASTSTKKKRRKAFLKETKLGIEGRGGTDFL